MKELSIEEKAKRYDEAIEIAREINNEQRAQPFNVMTRVFPELKESGDERIRKHLISLFEKFVTLGVANECETSEIKVDDILAWLKKQESYTFEIKEGHWYKCVCDYMPNGSDLMFKNDRLYYCRSDWRLAGEIDELNVKNIGVRGYKSFFRPATNQEIKDWLEKQGKSNMGISEATKQELENNLNKALEKETPESWNKFLEKQGEQKPDTDFSDLRTWKYIVDAVLTEKEGIGQYLDSPFTEEVAKKLQERFGNIEQKPADKVEPKFKVGDWVVSPNGVYWHIDAINNNRYEVSSTDGACADWPLDTDLYHLWTIQDAKDGDVLVNKDDSYASYIVLFKRFSHSEDDIDRFRSHCHCREGVFCSIEDVGWCCNGFYLATKEQRDFLFQKMKEVGYTFDFEKKELKKIEMKPAWSEEDEDNFKHILDEIVCLGNNRNSANRLYYDRLIKFIKELKNRAQPKEKWCDKDERMLDRLIAYFEKQVAFTDDDNPRYANWLKSLRPQNWTKEDKERYISCLQRLGTGDPKQPETINSKWFKEHVYPQSTWKPSEEQMKALADALSLANNCGEESAFDLRTLLEQLKKLREE